MIKTFLWLSIFSVASLTGVQLLANSDPIVPRPTFSTRPQWVIVQPAVADPGSDERSSISSDQTKGRLQIGESRPLAQTVVVDAGTAPASQWTAVAGGGRRWAIDLESTGALGLKVHLESLQLPDGTRLIIYDPARPEQTFRTMSGKRLQGKRELWTDTIFADKVRLECQVPPGADLSSVRFVISGLSHINRLPKASSQLKEGTCHNDVTCFPDWASQAAGVAWIVFVDNGRTYLCTGCLIDANAASAPDYFLTAHHCVGNQTVASTVEFYWFYQTSVCNGVPPDSSTVPRTSGGGDLLKTSSNSDFAFLRLRETPPGGTFRLGWSTASPTHDLAGIHHPDGAYKRISFGNSDGLDSHFWYVKWTSGVTEPGSSGSPLFNSDHKVIGQLYGGTSSCGNPSGLDKYGRFDLTYTQIRSWIDPGTNGIHTIPRGIYNGLFSVPGAVALENAGFVSLVVSTSGKFSGNLRLGAARYTFNGQFDANGAAQVLVKRARLSAWTLSLQLDSADTEHVTGSLTDGGWTATVEAGHSSFNSKTNPAPQIGHYNLLLPSANSDPASAPTGDSFLSIVIDDNGKAKASGSVADGSSVAASANLTRDGRFPFFATPYSGKGICLGWISFDPSGNASGQVTWIKPPAATAKSYPGGFSIQASATGGLFVRPANGTSVLNLSTGNITFSGGNLATAVSIPISIGVNNKVTNLGTNKLTMTVSPSSGLVTGKLSVPGVPKPLAFKGLADENQNIAGGYFLGTNEAGLMLLGP